ncbi:MAG: hypothetical protein OFPI_32380 [Osedax symbiont Rs2]|nr:MAG: hypothetical protein OFPI_32380 [Osedax symbiont Rs2]
MRLSKVLYIIGLIAGFRASGDVCKSANLGTETELLYLVL